MSLTFEVYNTSTLKSMITFGTNGFKIVYYDNAGREFIPSNSYVVPISIRFDSILIINSIITRRDYQSFTIEASSLEKPNKIQTFEIKMKDKINEVRKLIIDGYKLARIEKDNLLGIY
jgi:hypothetical protein